MKFGQMSFPRLCEESDYIQLDMCGLNSLEVLNKYKKYNSNKPIILHGDWSKKGFSENGILSKKRYSEYIEILNAMKNDTEVLGVTIHPPHKRKISLDDFTDLKNQIEKDTNVPVFIENRSSKNIHLSDISNIIEYLKYNKMTIDIPQLYITCGKEMDLLIHVLKNINLENIKELHMANCKIHGNHTYVGRKIYDGAIEIQKVIEILKAVPYCTLEILGGCNVFLQESTLIKDILTSDFKTNFKGGSLDE